MKIEVNVQRRYFLTILAVMLVLAGAVAVYATFGTAPNPGHLTDQLVAPTGCTAGQVLEVGPSGVGKDGAIVCKDKASGGGGSGGWQNMKVYDLVGEDSWSIPSGVNKVMVEAWGAGAGGSLCTTNGGGRSSGGGGGYGSGIYSVTPGDTLNMVIGSGGLSDSASAKKGGTTSVTWAGVSLVANGGGGSTENYAGGTITGAQFSILGRDGYYGLSEGVISIGGNAGNGGSGGIVDNGAAITFLETNANPTVPGGGGACGQNGAHGRVVISW